MPPSWRPFLLSALSEANPAGVKHGMDLEESRVVVAAALQLLKHTALAPLLRGGGRGVDTGSLPLKRLVAALVDPLLLEVGVCGPPLPFPSPTTSPTTIPTTYQPLPPPAGDARSGGA